MNGLQKTGVTTGMSAKTVGGNVADPTPQVNLHLAVIAMKKRMPMRILTGAVTGGLGSTGPAEQEAGSWDKQVRHYEVGYVTPHLIRPCVNMLCNFGVLPQPQKKRGTKCDWPDLTEMSSSELADIAAKRASAMAQYWQGSLAQGMTWHDFLTKELGYDEDEATVIVDNAWNEMQQTHGGTEPEQSALPVTIPEDDEEDVEDEEQEDDVGAPTLAQGAAT